MKNLSLALITLFALTVVSSSAFAWSPNAAQAGKKTENWNNWDTTFEIAYLATHIADWGQTRNLSSLCQTGAYQETNIILGDCPSTQAVNAYFLGTALIHAGIAYALPQKYRRLFQSATFAAQLGVVSSNASIGIKVKF